MTMIVKVLAIFLIVLLVIGLALFVYEMFISPYHEDEDEDYIDIVD